MEQFNPMYIRQKLEYKKQDIVTAEDFNNVFNLLLAASDHNSEVLNAIINDPATKLVQDVYHADDASHADVADDSGLLSGASLSRTFDGPLEENDNKIPSSKQVKEYIDAATAADANTFMDVYSRLDNIDSLNTTQNNRLANIDLINNQYGTRLTSLETRVGITEEAITGIRSVNLEQDAVLAQHNTRITNLELDYLPDDIVDELMPRGSYALNTGLDAEGNPTYSPDTVRTAQVANTVLLNGQGVDASIFAHKTNVDALVNDSFITRGAMPSPSGTYYTVGELRALKHGSYECTTAQSTALNTGGNVGTLRLYPCANGISLEYEIQISNNPQLLNLFIPTSVSGSTALNTLSWYDEYYRITQAESRVSTLEGNRLVVGNIKAGTDINVSTSGNNATIKYSGPRIVISSSQPSADSSRKTLWIAL
mgnify:CR=1 FL=1